MTAAVSAQILGKPVYRLEYYDNTIAKSPKCAGNTRQYNTRVCKHTIKKLKKRYLLGTHWTTQKLTNMICSDRFWMQMCFCACASIQKLVLSLYLTSCGEKMHLRVLSQQVPYLCAAFLANKSYLYLLHWVTLTFYFCTLNLAGNVASRSVLNWLRAKERNCTLVGNERSCLS